MRRLTPLVLTVALVVAGLVLVAQQPSRATEPDIILDAAGDLACAPGGTQSTYACRHPEVSNVVVADKAAADAAGKTFDFLTLGDNQYENAHHNEVGQPDEFCDISGTGVPGGWDPGCNQTGNYGRTNAYVHPVPGNHEYQSGNNGFGYYSYFGDKASPQQTGCTSGCLGYYSYDEGAWHVVVLNKVWPHGVGSTQYNWLASDLAASSKQCEIIAWHEPYYTSDSSSHTPDTTWSDVEALAYNEGVEMQLSGHQHWYERFAPQDSTRRYDPEYGVREFTIGTGGRSQQSPIADGIAAHSEVRTTTNGVQQFVLSDGSYTWNFHPRSGLTFNESGSGTCHGAPPGPVAQLKATAEDGTLNSFASTSSASVQSYKDQGSPAATGIPVNKNYYTVNTTSAAGWVKFDTTQVPQSKDCATVRSWVKVNSYTANESVDLLSIKHSDGSNWNSFDLWMNGTGTTLGWNLAAANSDSASFTVNKWTKLEVQACYGSSGTYTAQVWLDGVDQGSISSTGQSAADVSYIRFGHDVAKTQSFSVDHVAVNVSDTLPARFVDPTVLQSSGGKADLVGTAESGSLSDFGTTTGASVLSYTDQAATTNPIPINKNYYHVTSTAAPAYLKFTTTQVPQVLNCATTRFHFKVDSYTANESVSLFTAPTAAGSFNGLDIFMTSTSPNPTTLKWDLAAANADTVLINLDQWYRLDAQMCYGSTTYTAQVWLDGVDQGSISSTGQTASDISYAQYGTAGNKTQTKDFDHIAFGVGDHLPALYGPVTVSD